MPVGVGVAIEPVNAPPAFGPLEKHVAFGMSKSRTNDVVERNVTVG
jgi:hypothetical protein